MSVAQAKRTGAVTKIKTDRKNAVKYGLKHLLYFTLGVLFGYSGLNENFSPFGVAYVSATGQKMFPSSFAGACVGYVLSTDSVTSLRYIASLLALTVIYVSLRPFRQLRDNPVTPLISVFVCLLVTGLAIAFSKEITVLSLLICFCEAFLGCASSYLFSKVRTVVNLKGSFFSLTSKEATSVVIAGSLLLLAIKDISFFSLYPAHIISMLLVIICGYYSREAGGTIVGVCTGITMSFGSGNVFLLAYYSFGGLLVGVVSAYGKIISLVAFVLSGVAVSVIAYGNPGEMSIFAETLIACGLFLVLPKKITSKTEEILTPAVSSPIIDSVKGDIIRKLKNASEISGEICTSLNTVSQALVKSEHADMKNIYRKTKDSVCGSCGLYDVCWNEGYENTQDSFNTLICMKKEGVYLEYKSVPADFSSRCIRTEMVASSFNKLYAEYKIKERLDARVNEIYSLASEQFVNVSSLLDSLCDYIDDEVRFDMDLAARARNASSSCGFVPLESCCVINSFEKLFLELTLKTPEGTFDVSALTKQLEIVTDRKLSMPEIIREEKSIKLFYKERAELKAVWAGAQICCNSEKYSGDTYSVFTSDDGTFYALICDGMGTGMRAAVNSNLAVTLTEKLLKAGFGTTAAINTVNTSLISKSNDECSVTLDLVETDLYTGHIDFYKCGAASTFVKKQGKILEVNCPSLPLGIIKNAESSDGTGTLSSGDVFVMFSDGVREEDYFLIKSELKAFNGGNVRDFTNRLADMIKENQPERNDDITIVTVAITKE